MNCGSILNTGEEEVENEEEDRLGRENLWPLASTKGIFIVFPLIVVVLKVLIVLVQLCMYVLFGDI